MDDFSKSTKKTFIHKYFSGDSRTSVDHNVSSLEVARLNGADIVVAPFCENAVNLITRNLQLVIQECPVIVIDFARRRTIFDPKKSKVCVTYSTRLCLQAEF